MYKTSLQAVFVFTGISGNVFKGFSTKWSTIKGHSTTTWTKFYPILTPYQFPIVDMLHTNFPHETNSGPFTDHLPTSSYSVPKVIFLQVAEFSG